MSAILFVAFIAASPLASASHHLLRRQTAPATSTGLAAGDQESQCYYPPSLTQPTGFPTPPPDVALFIESATDLCPSTTAAGVASDYSSYTSAYNSWVDANSASILSIESIVVSYQASMSTQSQCSSYFGYSSGQPLETPTIVLSNFYAQLPCSTGGVFTGSISTASTPASTLATSSSAGSLSTATTSNASSISAVAASSSTTSTSTSASAASTTNAADPSFRADGLISTYFLLAGVSVAISTFLGMIVL